MYVDIAIWNLSINIGIKGKYCSKKSSSRRHICTCVLQLTANLKLKMLNSENTGKMKNMKIFVGTFL
jgi:hypothetical protein